MMSRIFGENLLKNHMMLFELLPFFEFCTLQFCKCDISESIIGRGSIFFQLVEYMRRFSGENLKKNHMIFFLINAV